MTFIHLLFHEPIKQLIPRALWRPGKRLSLYLASFGKFYGSGMQDAGMPGEKNCMCVFINLTCT